MANASRELLEKRFRMCYAYQYYQRNLTLGLINLVAVSPG